jgi:3-hydroxybutyryl-CoA dehydrogenase
MMVSTVERVCVVGAGNMGHQIAICAALAGYRVKCTDVTAEILAKAEKFADTYLPERVAKGKLSAEAASEARSNVAFVPKVEDAAGDADLVIEAIIEKLDVKRELFAQLDEIAPRHAILTTNSSYIVSSKIADATRRQAQVCNMHFFNPALVMKLVEVVKGPHVSDDTASTVMEVARKMGKTPVLLQKEIYGFLANRFIQAARKEALYLHDMGVASVEDIDTAVVNGLGYPMGPFRLMDLTGIDLAYRVGMERFCESGDLVDRPSPTIVEKYAKGEFGRKVGKGFYAYDSEQK